MRDLTDRFFARLSQHFLPHLLRFQTLGRAAAPSPPARTAMSANVYNHCEVYGIDLIVYNSFFSHAL